MLTDNLYIVEVNLEKPTLAIKTGCVYVCVCVHYSLLGFN